MLKTNFHHLLSNFSLDFPYIQKAATNDQKDLPDNLQDYLYPLRDI
jgi:hypothetical protein